MFSFRLLSKIKLQRSLKPSLNANKDFYYLHVRNASDVKSSRYRFEKESRNRGITAGNLLLLVFPAATLGLGIWQTKRRSWKLDLIDHLEKRTSALPVPLPNDLSELNDLEYSKIIVSGQFDHSREAYIGPKSFISNDPNDSGGGLFGNSETVGWHVVTPFILDNDNGDHSGRAILVNRGWVPKKNISPATRLQGQVEGKVFLVGVVRKTEQREQFAPKNQNTDKPIFSYRDIVSMSERLNTLPVFLDADKDSSVPNGPIGGQTKVNLRNDHLSYMFTWYALSGSMLYLWIRRFILKK